ncbi:MAG TPA: hypothetical protein VFS21_20325 [Roseiflexaceae bacterium]|nr:hypothetical protein [Roseiflexaceae bacterium]
MPPAECEQTTATALQTRSALPRRAGRRTAARPSKIRQHIEALSNGLGAQSMYLLVLAAQGRIPARLSITADTGWEEDCLWSDGTRSTARHYFEQIVQPYADAHGIEAVMVEALDKDGQPIPPLGEWVRQHVRAGTLNQIKIPLFGSNGGRLGQSCTSRKKVAAIRQELRRRGATTARTAQGLHRGEITRMKGRHGRMEGGFFTLTSIDAAWQSHFYPLIDLGLFRADVQRELEHLRIPYLISSQCDGCPHKDLARWERTSPEVIDDLADLEAEMDGQFFFTNKRVPLREALVLMRQDAEKRAAQLPISMFELDDFGCDGGICGV